MPRLWPKPYETKAMGDNTIICIIVIFKSDSDSGTHTDVWVNSEFKI